MIQKVRVQYQPFPYHLVEPSPWKKTRTYSTKLEIRKDNKTYLSNPKITSIKNKNIFYTLYNNEELIKLKFTDKTFIDYIHNSDLFKIYFGSLNEFLKNNEKILLPILITDKIEKSFKLAAWREI